MFQETQATNSSILNPPFKENSVRTNFKLSPVVIAVAALMATPIAFASTNSQKSYSNYQGSNVVPNSTQNTMVGGNAARDSSGNIGLNVATGNQNQQSNAGSIATNKKASTINASTNGEQSQAGNLGIQSSSGGNSVSLTNQALQGAAGNIGANMASGMLNQQQNNLGVAQSGSTKTAIVNTTIKQKMGYGKAGGNTSGTYYDNQQHSANAASISGSALSDAVGNIGVNQAAGISNQQNNTLDLASVSQGNAQSAQANVNTNQAQANSWAGQMDSGANVVGMAGQALKNAAGNIGVNMAAGAFNQQQNGASIVSVKNVKTLSAKVNTKQKLDSVFNLSTNNPAGNQTGLQHDVLRNASGNIGVNEASGLSNQQSNSTALSTGDKSSTATATVATTQILSKSNNSEGLGYYKFGRTFAGGPQANHADVSDALRDAAGNIGVNIASGTSNQQSNSLAIAASKNSSKSATRAIATGAVVQKTEGNLEYDLSGAHDSSLVHGNAARSAVGNVGINVATGGMNQQSNGLALTTVSANALASASAPVSQVTYGNAGTTSGSSYNSKVSGNALLDASGNIGTNVAAGNGNQQANTLAIASFSH